MIHSLMPYVLLSLGLMASIFLFLSIKREIRSVALKNRKKIEEMQRRIAEVPAAREREPIFIPASPRPGMNISKRVHAMRMVRRNEDVGYIAAALGISRKEVELLIRVQGVTAARAAR